MTRKLQAFPWYGGKYRMFSFLSSHMPRDDQHFVDVFGGSGVVLLNRLPSRTETYNDINGEVVNFFRVLRDDGDALIRALELTPYSREEMVASRDRSPDLEPLELARRFFCVAQQCFGGLAQRKSDAPWAYEIGCARGQLLMSERVQRWLNKVDRLPEIVERLRVVQIENSTALDILKRFDRDTTFFYCDPPYVHSTRSIDNSVYTGEMNDDEHREFANVLNSIKGRAMVSGYRGELYDDLFASWRRVDEKPHFSSFAKDKRQESIWMNYPEENEVGDLF